MCGITGFVNLGSSSPPLKKTLLNMNAQLIHRGPDDEGFYYSKNIGLAMRRLSIVDVKGGQQPVYSQDKKIKVIFNGEIYNHIELRQRLIKKGYHFRSNSDSEIIPAMYLEYGIKMVNHFNGMFAIALWDGHNRKLILFRDRFGQKPLFTTIHQNVFYFASEIKALLAIPKRDHQWNFNAFKQYLYLGQILGPGTAFKNIFSLAPGHYQVIKKDYIGTPKPYWDITINPQSKIKKQDALEELKHRLEKSVTLRLRSDVPVATTLSGGLDSSTILYFAKKLNPKDAHAFSITFNDIKKDTEKLDESRFQYQVAQKINVALSEFDFFKHKKIISKSFNTAYTIYESPDSVVQQEIVFTYLAKMMADQGYKVGLGGEGADEFLKGYEWYDSHQSYLDQLDFKKPHQILKSSKLSKRNRKCLNEEINFIEEWGYPSSLFGEQLAWKKLQSLFDDYKLPPIFTNEDYGGPREVDFSCSVKTKKLKEHFGQGLLQYADIKLRLPEFILNVQDRFSMAGSIEMRSPFMDHNLAQWLVNLPDKFKRFDGEEKYIVKQLMKKDLPKSILKRKKQGYTAPLLQTDYDANKTHLDRLMTKKTLEDFGVFNPNFIKALKKAPQWVIGLESDATLKDLFWERIQDIQAFIHAYDK